MRRLIILISVSILLGTTSASACYVDSNCGYGSKCVKSGYSVQGVCVGGSQPGSAYDSEQDSVFYRKGNSSYGKTCTYDAQCGYGLSCTKSAYSFEGTCL